MPGLAYICHILYAERLQTLYSHPVLYETALPIQVQRRLSAVTKELQDAVLLSKAVAQRALEVHGM